MAWSWANAVVAQRRASRDEVRQYFADVHDSLCTSERADRAMQPAFVDAAVVPAARAVVRVLAG
jgi:hypothetical protein